MNLKEYYKIIKKKKSFLAELDRKILDCQQRIKWENRKLELDTREAKLAIKEKDLNYILELQNKIKTLQDQIEFCVKYNEQVYGVLMNDPDKIVVARIKKTK